VPGNSILEAAATIRDTIAFAENKGIPMCALSLDFRNAFDRIAHEHLFQVLQAFGIEEAFIQGIKQMYEGATSSVQINGHSYGPIPIRSAIRQGCPLSMALYTLCLHPMLKYLEQKLSGIRIGRRARPTDVVAYADVVTIFISSVTEFPIIEEALQRFEKASGANINPRKSKALAVGRWRAQQTIRGIQYYPSVTILGINFWATTDQTTRDTWSRITGKVRMQAKKAYDRDPCLAHRIQYVHKCLLEKLWYTAQILPLARPYTQQLTTAVTWYIWKGSIFRVKLSTLQRPKRMGGMGLIDIAAKCRALLLGRVYRQGHNDKTVTAAWMRYWNLTGRRENPPHDMQIPGKYAYLHCYAIDMAYIQHTERHEAQFRKVN
jgi:hypothetical protein